MKITTISPEDFYKIKKEDRTGCFSFTSQIQLGFFYFNKKDLIYLEKGEFHNENGPAIEFLSFAYLKRLYFIKGKARTILPFVEEYKKEFLSTSKSYINDIEEDTSYVKRIYDDNLLLEEQYFNQDGRPHREDGPAVTTYHKNGNVVREEYFEDGETSRIDGPAIIGYKENGLIKFKQYRFCGELPSDEEISFIKRNEQKKINKTNLKSKLESL